MKFHQLRLQNLNALYGNQHPILFDRDLNAPIFLILGPTGAGKSTLLDAISLALFGQTPRLSQSQGLISTHPALIMSSGTSSCWAELEFSRLDPSSPSGRAHFRATWSCRRARDKVDGHIQKPSRKLERRLPNDSWETLFDGSAVNAADRAFASALDNLSVHDFHRTVILPQGEFSAFLKASHAERAHILERLTNTDLYRAIGARAHDRFQAIDHTFKSLQEHLNAAGVPPPELIPSIRSKIEDSQAAATALQSLLNLYSLLRDALHNLLQSQHAHLAYHHELLFFQKKKQDHAATLQLLSLDRRCRVAESDLKVWFDTRNALSDQSNRLEMIKSEKLQYSKLLEEQSEQKKIAQQYVNQLKDDQIVLLIKLKAAREAITQRTLAQKDLEFAQANLLAPQKSLQLLSLSHRKDLDSLSALRQDLLSIPPIPPDLPSPDPLRNAISSLSALLPPLSTLLSERPALQTQTSSLSALLPSLTSQIAALQTQIATQTTLLSASPPLPYLPQTPSRALSALKLLSHLTTQRSHLHDKTEQNRIALALAQRTLSELPPQIAAAQALLPHPHAPLLSSIRSELSPSDPCPLCASPAPLPHPPPPPDPLAHDLLSNLQRSLSETQTLSQHLSQTLSNLAQSAAELSLDHDKNYQQLKTFLSELNIDPPPPPLSHPAISSLETQIHALADQKTKRDQQQRELDALSSKLALLSQQRASSEQQLTQNTALIFANESKTHHIIQQINDTLARLSPPPTPISPDNIQINNIKILQQSLTKQLANIETHTLNQKKSAQIKEKIELLENSCAERALKISELENDIKELKLKVDAQNAALSSANTHVQIIIGSQNPDELEKEFTQRLDAAQTALLTHDSAIQTTQNNLNQSLGALFELQESILSLQNKEQKTRENLEALVQSLSLSSIDELSRSLLAYDERTHLEALESSLNKEEQELKAQVESALNTMKLAEDTWNDRKKAIEPGIPVGDTLEEIDQWLLEHRANLTEQQQRTGELTAELRHAQQLHETHRKRLDELISLGEEHQHWAELNKLIGARNGEAFRDFAQSITLQVLIEYANVWLNELTDRYSLTCISEGDDKPPLQFAVEDNYQAKDVRPVTTLSGGESFIVSLALALGLADCAGVTLPIETLLLDEGFGTLDANSLQIVMEALARLQERKGVQLGLISHVEALQKQIRSRIFVERVGPGRSRVRVSPEDDDDDDFS